ncbi:MAG: LPS export ABC transporter periplasmic protein LptC [Cyanobacteria bacterium P01_A01_bin.37]
MKIRIWSRFLFALFLAFPLMFGAASCDRRSQSSDENAESSEEPNRDLSFNNITLEQSDDDGNLLWRMVAGKAVYSQDEQTAVIENPSGEFFQDDQATLKIQATRGEVRDDGDRIFLTGNVVATDVETGAIVRGDELEWRTGQEVVIVRNNIIGVHPDFTIAANRARVSIVDQRVEVNGNVAAISADEDLKLQGSEIVWLLEDDLLLSDRPIQIQQLDGDEVTGQAQGERAEFNLATEVALLENNGRVVLKDPAMRLTGDSLQWDLVQNTIVASQPLRIIYREEEDETVTLRANQGNGNLNTQIFSIAGDAVITSQRNQSRLSANQIRWNVDTDDFVAEGNVVYRQTDPVANLQGDRAEGQLRSLQSERAEGQAGNRTRARPIIVTGNQVVTEFIPESSN